MSTYTIDSPSHSALSWDLSVAATRSRRNSGATLDSRVSNTLGQLLVAAAGVVWAIDVMSLLRLH